MNRKMKIVCAALSLAIVLIMTTTAFAVTPGSIVPDTTGSEKVVNLGKKITGIIQVVGIIASVGVIIVLGIKYMMGSAEEKAEYKKTLLPYFIGAAFVFAGSALANTIYAWVTTTIK